jgi:XTP/dITP diphosphohydrolase
MKLLLATRNLHKVSEIRSFLGDRLTFLTLQDLPTVPDIQETGDTFTENATLKASALARWVVEQHPHLLEANGQLQVLADDSGLEVDALHGAPGVRSARFAVEELDMQGNSPDQANNDKLLRLLSGVPLEKRTARFRCFLALARAGFVSTEEKTPAMLVLEGVCEGSILLMPRGARGFGYDPLFVPAGYELSFAELGEEAKNRLSHRAKALAQLNSYLDASEGAAGILSDK